MLKQQCYTNQPQTGIPELYIAVNKNRVKSHNRDIESIVYLEDGSEFQLELYNKSDKVQKAEIWINGVCQSSSLVLRPGVHYYLDRFMDTDKKLAFSTYDVDDVKEAKEAIKKNGLIEVRFYAQNEPPTITWATYGSYPTWIQYEYPHQHPYTYPITITCQSNNTVGNYKYDMNILNATSTNTSTYFTANASMGGTLNCNGSTPSVSRTRSAKSSEKQIETGRVEEGNESDQSFQPYNGSFSTYANTIIKYHILPVSQKQKEVTPGELREYCSECGRRLKNGWKFCAGCGKKV